MNQGSGALTAWRQLHEVAYWMRSVGLQIQPLIVNVKDSREQLWWIMCWGWSDLNEPELLRAHGGAYKRKVVYQGRFHEPTNHADERQWPKRIDQRDRLNWSADQCCLVFPLNCSHWWFSGWPIDHFYSVLDDLSAARTAPMSIRRRLYDAYTRQWIFLGRRTNFSNFVASWNGPFRHTNQPNPYYPGTQTNQTLSLLHTDLPQTTLALGQTSLAGFVLPPWGPFVWSDPHLVVSWGGQAMGQDPGGMTSNRGGSETLWIWDPTDW